MTDMIEHFRKILVDQQTTLQSDAHNNADASKPVELDQTRVGRLSRMDAMQGQAMSMQTQRRRQQQMLKIQAALSRLDNEDYGYCLECSNEIPIKRLEIDPCVTLCIQCAAIKESKHI